MLVNEPIQPTDPHLIWGRSQDRADRRFQARAAIVEHLISRWTKPSWSGVDVSGGAGRWLPTLAPHFAQFAHLDLSPEALDVAQTSHPEFENVEYGRADLLRPRDPDAKTWDAAFCLDTLLYRGDFVETALKNIPAFIRPGGILIMDVPALYRASFSQYIKGRHYRGPERKFTPTAAHRLTKQTGYTCLATAYHYSELSAQANRRIAEQGLTDGLPWPSTWIYLVLRPTKRQ